MKKIKLFALLAVASFYALNGCKKRDAITSLNGFNVTADKQSYNIGDTIVFSINEDADIIEFYSGKPGYNVNNRNRNSGSGTNILQFQTEVLQASAKNNGDTILLKICTNLNSYDSTGVANATWTDITSSANWPAVTTTGFVRSGAVNISQFNTADSVYIAFEVLGQQRTTTAQREWEIQKFTLGNTLPDSTFTPLFAPPFTTGANLGTDTLSYFANVGWTEVNMNYSNNLSYFVSQIDNAATTFYDAWNVGNYGLNATNGINVNNKPCNNNYVQIATNYPLIFNPGPTSLKSWPSNNGWVISSPVNLNLVRHDFPTAELKDEARASSAKGLHYGGASGVFATYTYAVDSTFVSGKTYNMAFVAQNHSVDKGNEVIKYVSIKIN
jgi:hypothetical protein